MTFSFLIVYNFIYVANVCGLETVLLDISILNVVYEVLARCLIVRMLNDRVETGNESKF